MVFFEEKFVIYEINRDYLIRCERYFAFIRKDAA